MLSSINIYESNRHLFSSFQQSSEQKLSSAPQAPKFEIESFCFDSLPWSRKPFCFNSGPLEVVRGLEVFSWEIISQPNLCNSSSRTFLHSPPQKSPSFGKKFRQVSISKNPQQRWSMIATLSRIRNQLTLGSFWSSEYLLFQLSFRVQVSSGSIPGFKIKRRLGWELGSPFDS